MLACFLLAACAGEPPPQNVAISPDGPVAALNLSSWAFAVASRTHGNPVSAARACAAVDYLAGYLNSSPQYQFMSVLTRQQMLQARVEIRARLGILPGLPSQTVVDVLLATANALQAGNRAAALRALATPGFTLPPQQTLALLDDLPFMPTVNVATMRASQQAYPSDGSSLF